MPVAQPFKALGRGNGFPFCISFSVNVLDGVGGNPYAYWTTLGGFNKDSGGTPSQEQIDLSLRNAMKLFWNLYALDGIAMGDGGGYPLHEVNQVGFGEYTFNGFPSSITDADGEPWTRVCLSNFGPRIIKRNQISVGASELEIYFQFSRMYLGDTTDEDNFIGYGFGGFFGDASSVGTRVQVELQSAFEITHTPLPGQVVEYAYTTISGIPFVCEARARRSEGDGDTGSTMVDASGRRATASHANSDDGVPYNNSEVLLDSLEVFTY